MTVAPDFGPYESGSGADWEQRTLAALRSLGHDATIGNGGVLHIEPQIPLAPTPIKQRERLHSADSRLYGHFLDYCEANTIDLDGITAEARPAFALQAHAFLLNTSTQYLAARKKALQQQEPGLTLGQSIIPGTPVTRGLDEFYRKYGQGLERPDKVSDHLREQALRGYMAVAQGQYKVFPEVRGVIMLTQSLLGHRHEQAAIATSELTAAYGMALSVIRKGPAQRPEPVPLDRTYGIPEEPID